MYEMSGLAATTCEEQLDDFISAHAKTLPGKVIFAKLWGSWSHHCQVASSDFDFLAVYMAPTAEHLGMVRPTDTVVHDKPDYQAYELGKFAHLLLSGNPGVVECLFTSQFAHAVYPFTELVENRHRFLTQSCVDAYAGYARGQLKKLRAGQSVHSKGGEPGEKWAYHFCRLMGDALSIANGGEPTVIKYGDTQKFLLGIRRGEVSLADAVAYVDFAESELTRLRPWKVQPPVDMHWLHNWLIRARMAYDYVVPLTDGGSCATPDSSASGASVAAS